MNNGVRLALLSAVFGYLGGAITTWTRPVLAAPVGIVRSTRFELTDDDGNRVAIWGRDADGKVAITFSGRNGKERASFGRSSDDFPFLDLTGADGKARLTMRLMGEDKPVLGMGDSNWEGRVLLGVVAPGGSSQVEDGWGLLFRAPGRHTDLASIGVVSSARGVKAGRVTVRASTGETWSEPKH